MLLDENAQLKSTIIDLNRKVSELTPAQKENEMLYNFLELKKERNDIKFVNADIISRVSSNYTSEITFDTRNKKRYGDCNRRQQFAWHNR